MAEFQKGALPEYIKRESKQLLKLAKANGGRIPVRNHNDAEALLSNIAVPRCKDIEPKHVDRVLAMAVGNGNAVALNNLSEAHNLVSKFYGFGSTYGAVRANPIEASFEQAQEDYPLPAKTVPTSPVQITIRKRRMVARRSH